MYNNSKADNQENKNMNNDKELIEVLQQGKKMTFFHYYCVGDKEERGREN